MSSSRHSNYQRFADNTCNSSAIAARTFQDLFKSIKRRVQFKQGFRDPWAINITIPIHQTIFLPVFRAIRDNHVHHNLSIQVPKRDREGRGEQFYLVFKRYGEAIYHLHMISNLTKEEVKEHFKKEGTNKRTAEVVISMEMSFSITYDKKNQK